MEDDHQITQSLSHLLARVAAFVARDDEPEPTPPSLPQFSGSLWAPTPQQQQQRTPRSSSFFSLASDVNSDTDTRWASTHHTRGCPIVRPSAVSPVVLSPPAAKTPSAGASPHALGLTPTNYGASGSRAPGLRGGAATATTSASSTPFWVQQPHACGVSVCDPLSSLNLMHNLSPVNTPITTRASQQAQQAQAQQAQQAGLVLLGGNSYTLRPPGRSSVPISPLQPQPQSAQCPRPPPHLHHVPHSHSTLDILSGSLRDGVGLSPGRHTNTNTHMNMSTSTHINISMNLNAPPLSPPLSLSLRSPSRDAAGPLSSPPRADLLLTLRPSAGTEHCPLLRTDALRQLSSSGRSPDAAVRVPFQLSAHRGCVVKMGSDQHGCRALQSALETYAFGSSEVQCIVSELRPVLSQVMTNPYGNFLVQKLLEIAPDEERLQLLSQYLSNSLCEVAVSPHGNYAVQKLIDSLRSREEAEVVCGALRRNVLVLMNDLNGGHVVQKLLQCLPQEDVVFLYDTIVDRTLDVCNDKQGCCIVQKCMDCASEEHLQRLQRAILHHLPPLSMSPYGNYVVTHLINCCKGTQRYQVVDDAAFCAGPVMDVLCVNKFASNVVENIVRHCSEHAKVELCRLILRGSLDNDTQPFNNNSNNNNNSGSNSARNTNDNMTGGQNSTVLRTIALSPYGNYVVQTLLSVLPVGAELLKLLRCLQRLLPELLELNFGKRVEAKMDHAKARVAQHAQQRALSSFECGGGATTATATAAAEGLFAHSAVLSADAAAAQVTHPKPFAATAATATVTATTAAAVLLPRRNAGDAVKSVGQGGNSYAFFAPPSPSLVPPAQQQQQQQQQRQSNVGSGARYKARREGRSK